MSSFVSIVKLVAFGALGYLVIALGQTIVLVTHADGNPIWFDLGGALTLMLATAAGGWLRSRQRRHSGPTGSSRNGSPASSPTL